MNNCIGNPHVFCSFLNAYNGPDDEPVSNLWIVTKVRIESHRDQSRLLEKARPGTGRVAKTYYFTPFCKWAHPHEKLRFRITSFLVTSIETKPWQSLRSFVLKMKSTIHQYHIVLTNGELLINLRDIRVSRNKAILAQPQKVLPVQA